MEKYIRIDLRDIIDKKDIKELEKCYKIKLEHLIDEYNIFEITIVSADEDTIGQNLFVEDYFDFDFDIKLDPKDPNYINQAYMEALEKVTDGTFTESDMIYHMITRNNDVIVLYYEFEDMSGARDIIVKKPQIEP